MNQDNISADKALIIHGNMPIVLLGNLIGSSTLAIVQWNENHAFQITLWIGVTYFFSALRLWHYRSFNAKTASADQIQRQFNVYWLFAFLSGLLWGSSSLIIFNPLAITEFSFLLITLITMMAGSMASLSSRPIVYASFALPTIFPLIGLMFYAGGSFYYWMVFGTLSYLIATFAFSRNYHCTIHNSLLLKYQNHELVSNLKKQTKTANKASADKSRFLAAASHDLRQPLHAINLFVETLSTKLTQPEQTHDLDKIRHGLDSLSELFNALLDISQFDSNTFHINKTSFQLSELIQKIKDQFTLDAQTKNICLEFKHCDQLVHSDPVLLERLIRNLLSNAIRYTEKGSIEVYCSQHLEHGVNIHIVDTGIGIPQQEKDNVFKEFYQLHNPERDRNKGLGLGLAIVLRIAKALGHTVECHSIVQKGTEFIIQIQQGELKAPQKITQSPQSQYNNLKGLKVLVIDNELEILEGMRHLLTTWECQFTGADSTEKALSLIDDGYSPQFILSDYRMPGALNGCQIIKKINIDIPALIITGDTGVDVIEEIETNQLMALNKPLKPAQLRLAMTRLLKNSINSSLELNV